VRRLDLSYNPLGRGGLEVLARQRGIPALRTLLLQGLEMGSQGAEFLAAAPLAPGWRSLGLACNGLGDAGVAALAAAELGQLVHLELYRNQVGPIGAAALARSPHLLELRDLRLNCNSLGAKGVSNLLGSHRLLHRLYLFDCGLGDEGVRALARSPALTGLTHLELGLNGITDEGAKALARSRYLGNLRRLDFQLNHIGDEGVAALARSKVLQSVTHLTLNANRIGLKGIRALARSPNLSRLRRLDLHNNFIDDRCALALARSPTLPDSPVFVLWLKPQGGFGARAEEALKERFGNRVR
jgi:Ran GTPase-activating protein (RanGAP) involved in mRNA processing and transport